MTTTHDMPLDAPPPCADPHLGIASTAMLLDELQTRMEMDIQGLARLGDPKTSEWDLRDACLIARATLSATTLEYRTVDGR